MLPALAGGLLLVALVLAPGYTLWRAFGPTAACHRTRRPVDSLEAAACVLASGLLVTGWLALTLAQASLLRLPLLTLLVALLTGAAIGAARRAGRSLRPGRPRLSMADGVGLVIALLALLLALRPHQVVIGGLDAGVYVNSGANIARTGAIEYRDPIAASLATTVTEPRLDAETPEPSPPGAEDAIRHLLKRLPDARFPFADFLRFDGFYLSSLATGTITPQFFHLYPVWLGLVGQAMGDAAMLFTTPFFGWLGAVMIALAGRRLYGPWTGNVTLLLLGLNNLQIWFSRHSLSEALLEFLLATAIFGWVAAHPAEPAAAARPATPEPYFLALAGAAIGSFGLAHAQFVFFLPLLPLLVIWLWLARRWHPAYWAFLVPWLLLLDHTLLTILTITLGYFEGLYHHVILDLWDARALVFAALHLGVVVLALLGWQRDRWWPLVSHPRLHRLGSAALAAVVGLTFAYAYLIRPGLLEVDHLRTALSDPGVLAGYIGAPVPLGPEANLVRLGWYFSPLGILLAGVGTVAIVARLNIRLLPLLALAGIHGLAFNLASFTHESYIYSLRRFIPIVVPALSLAAAYAIVHVLPTLLGRLRLPLPGRRWLLRAPSAGLLALLVLFFLVTGRTIIQHVEYEGAPEQIAAIAAHFTPNDIVIFSGPRDEPHKLATPLHFFHGLDTLVVSTNNPRGDSIAAWLAAQRAQGRSVRMVLGDNGGKLLLPGLRLEPREPITLTLREFERLADQKPYNVQTNQLTYTIYDVVPAEGAPIAGPPYVYTTGPGDEAATVIGWYGREHDQDGTAYRWTNGSAMLRIPWPAERRPMRLRVQLSGGVRPPALGPAEVTLALARGQGDREAVAFARLTLPEDFTTYELTIPPDLLPDQPTNTAMLWLVNESWRPDEHGVSKDPRSLGVRLAGLELTEEPRG